MGATMDKSLNAELWVRISFVAGAGNDVQTIEYKPCGYNATWAIYWNEHYPYSHNRSRVAKVVGPRYTSVNGGGKAQLLSNEDKDLFPCTEMNAMGGFADGSDPACCDALATDAEYMAAQQVGCPATDCMTADDPLASCAFPPTGPLHCACSSYVFSGDACDADYCSSLTSEHFTGPAHWLNTAWHYDSSLNGRPVYKNTNE